jgi:hypothetical protein
MTAIVHDDSFHEGVVGIRLIEAERLLYSSLANMVRTDAMYALQLGLERRLSLGALTSMVATEVRTCCAL